MNKESFCRRAGCENCIHSIIFYPQKQSDCPLNDLDTFLVNIEGSGKEAAKQ